MPELWPHQERALAELEEAIRGGYTRICVTAPTGAGKTLMMRTRIREANRSAVVYTNRKMVREQMSRGLAADGIHHGVRAAGVAPALLRDVQVSSVQTESSRVYRSKKWALHDAQEVHVDEAHAQANGVAEKLLNDHHGNGAVLIGWTATPLGIGHLYDKLIVAGTNSEMRACGAHLPCVTYGPDEPDLKNIGPVKVGEDLTEEQQVKAIMRPGIFGRVYDWWQRLNKDAQPSLLFAPGVKESIWFAEQFQRKGVPAAHIDGENIWIMGETYPSTQEMRDQLAESSRLGEVKIVTNRFVMREGVDWPWLAHLIMGTVFGSLGTYLQAGGRLLRSHHSLDHVTCQDHGGNWHRHGSLNADREWDLSYTPQMVSGLRERDLREKKVEEPIRCPQCGKIRAGGAVCKSCGHRSTANSRQVVQHDGQLKVMEGEVYKPHKTKELPSTRKLWERMYYRAKNSRNEMTFNQAIGLFHYEQHYRPPTELPLMPKRAVDWFRKVKDVPLSDLIPRDPNA